MLKDSRVSRVRDTSLLGVVCISGSSKLEIYNSEFTWSNATALACFDQAQLLLHGSRVAHNHVPKGRGGGVVAYDSSKVVITGRSRVHNNTAEAGGGFAAWDSTAIFINGSSQVDDNRAHVSGGGVWAVNSSSLTVAENSSVHNNVAEPRHEESLSYGGGVAAYDTARVTITTNSSVHGNSAFMALVGCMRAATLL